MTPIAFIAALSIAAAVLMPSAAEAGPGHDHDHGDAAPIATGTALPRFAATSELFELVGVLDCRRVTLYLDRTTDNSPVTGAQIELEIAGVKLQPAARDDLYEVELAAAPKPGVLPVTATVTSGQDIDLLAGELDIPDDGHHAEAAHVHGWQAYAGWGAGAVAALVVFVLVGRRVAAGRQARTGAAA
jgi:hypothetical protein